MIEPSPLAIVITTVESQGDANQLAKAIIDKSLAACVQIDGPVTSHYRWSGEIQCTQEYRLTFKSTNAAWPALKEALVKQHPYDEPQIIKLAVTDSTDGYRDWVIDQTT